MIGTDRMPVKIRIDSRGVMKVLRLLMDMDSSDFYRSKEKMSLCTDEISDRTDRTERSADPALESRGAGGVTALMVDEVGLRLGERGSGSLKEMTTGDYTAEKTDSCDDTLSKVRRVFECHSHGGRV